MNKYNFISRNTSIPGSHLVQHEFFHNDLSNNAYCFMIFDPNDFAACGTVFNLRNEIMKRVVAETPAKRDKMHDALKAAEIRDRGCSDD